MTDEALIARLRDEHVAASRNEAADRIEALIAERDQWIAHAKNAIWANSEELQAAEAKLAENEVRLGKAVELALEECPFREGTGSYNDWWHDRRATLAAVAEPHKIKSGVATTPYGLEGESHE